MAYLTPLRWVIKSNKGIKIVIVLYGVILFDQRVGKRSEVDRKGIVIGTNQPFVCVYHSVCRSVCI